MLLSGDPLLAHLEACGVDLSQLVVENDNASEFGGKRNRRRGLPPLTELVEQKNRCRRHRFNPPHRPTYNSDVEALHGIMEVEFYQLGHFSGFLEEFLFEAYAYQLYFNLLRPLHSAKGDLRPEQLRQARAPSINAAVYLLPPVMLSSLEAQRQVLPGHDVPGYVNFFTPRLSSFPCFPGPDPARAPLPSKLGDRKDWQA